MWLQAVAGAAQGAAADRLSTRNPAEDLEKMQLAYTQLENIIAIMESGCEKLSKLEDALPVGLSYSEVQDMGKPCPPGCAHTIYLRHNFVPGVFLRDCLCFQGARGLQAARLRGRLRAPYCSQWDQWHGHISAGQHCENTITLP